MPPKVRCTELKKLPKTPTPLKTINFRRTTPGSGVVIVTNHATQRPSQLFDPKYPGAHLPFQQRRSLTPRWTSPYLKLFATPKAFLSKPDARYPEPFKLRPYPAPPIKPEQRRADMSMQVVAIRSRIVLHQALRGTVKRRLREAVKLIVTRGAAVEESPKGPKIVFRAEDVGADKWIAPDWTYIAMPTSELFRMPFAELLSLMRQALEYLRQSIPEAEKILRYGDRENGGPTSLGGKVGLMGSRFRFSGKPQYTDKKWMTALQNVKE